MTNQSARIKEHAEVILVDRTSFFSTEDIRKGIDILADREHINILKQGIDTWNAWRKEYPEVRPDLSGAYNSGPGILSANLSDTYLISPNLSGANFTNADLNNTDLSGVNLSDAILSGANLSRSDLLSANLSDAILRDTNFRNAILRNAILSRTDLRQTNFLSVDLMGADLSEARVAWTVFGDVDLSMVKGLETVSHVAPSTIGINTLYRSGGNIPEAFLRGTGVDDTFITYIHSLVNKPIDYYSCFINYSSKDQEFAERLHTDLESKNVRCWYAPEDLKIGDKFRMRIDESIGQYDKLLLILSKHSVTSPWVEKEVETAFEKENKTKRLVLFPIKLDNTVMETNQAWAADIRRMRHIGDFTRWKEHDEYQKGVNRLLRDLKQEATKEKA